MKPVIVDPEESWGDLPPIESRFDAQRAMRAIARLRAEADDELGPIRDELHRITELAQERERIWQNKIDRELERLEGWHRAALAADVVGPTVHSAYGRTLIRKAPVRVHVDDVMELVDWAMDSDNLEVIEVIQKPVVKEIKALCSRIVAGLEKEGQSDDAVTDDGEIIPGVHFERGASSFTFTPAEEVAE